MTTKHHEVTVPDRLDATFETLNQVGQHVALAASRSLARFAQNTARLMERLADRQTEAQPPTRHRNDQEPAPGEPVAEVVRAWQDLREHPALVWVPPVWRTAGLPDDTRTTHMWRAIDKNLVVKVIPDKRGMAVRLATGPLLDKELNGRVDPTNPASTIDPTLDVTAESFGQAVLALRDAVIAKYGPAQNGTDLVEGGSLSHSTPVYGVWGQDWDVDEASAHLGGVRLTQKH